MLSPPHPLLPPPPFPQAWMPPKWICWCWPCPFIITVFRSGGTAWQFQVVLGMKNAISCFVVFNPCGFLFVSQRNRKWQSNSFISSQLNCSNTPTMTEGFNLSLNPARLRPRPSAMARPILHSTFSTDNSFFIRLDLTILHINMFTTTLYVLYLTRYQGGGHKSPPPPNIYKKKIGQPG